MPLPAFAPGPEVSSRVLASEHTEWGPMLTDSPNRVFCTLASSIELPFHHLVVGEIEKVEVADLDDPALYFRGDYRRLHHRN